MTGKGFWGKLRLCENIHELANFRLYFLIIILYNRGDKLNLANLLIKERKR